MNIQSYIANISVSKSLEEIITLFENTGDITALDSLFVKNAFVEWTAPKWIKNDDIVFFMFSVSSKQTIRHLLKEFSKNNEKYVNFIKKFHMLNKNKTSSSPIE